MGKIGRNDPCPCGSGKKYKRCCLKKEEAQRLATIRERQELFEDETYEYDENDSDENQDYDEELDENPDYDEEFEIPEKVPPRKNTSREVPKIGEQDNAIVDAWWDTYEKLRTAEEIRQHLETFLAEHPELVPNLELDNEVLFELGGLYICASRHGEYIELLKKMRRQFADSYIKAFGYYDRDIICYCLKTGQKDEIDGYLGYFKEYPDHDPDNLFSVLDILMANNCQDIVSAFVRQIYYKVCTSEGIIGGEAIMDPVVFSYFMPFLKPDLSNIDMERLSNELKALKYPIKKAFLRPEFLKKKFQIIFGDYTQWRVSDCKTREAVYDRYNDITLNFMRFLHEKKNKDWMAAEYFRKMIYQFYAYAIPERKIPKEVFAFTKGKIDETICNMSQSFLFIESTKALGVLNAIYYFADYLEITKTIAQEKKYEIQRWCSELFDQAFPGLVKQDFSAILFENFPL